MSLLRLLTWASPAFPTGGYAYSHGLEWAVEAGDVTNEAQALDWIDAVLTDGTGRQDAIMMRRAYAGADAAVLAAAVAAATAPSAERRAETLGQGAAFALASAVWDDVPPAAYPVAWGCLARQQDVPFDQAALAMLHALAANLVSAAVRLVPLGQTAGLRILAALEPTILRIAQDPADDLGGACFRSDIAAMRHETQHTRLFRS